MFQTVTVMIIIVIVAEPLGFQCIGAVLTPDYDSIRHLCPLIYLCISAFPCVYRVWRFFIFYFFWSRPIHWGYLLHTSESLTRWEIKFSQYFACSPVEDCGDYKYETSLPQWSSYSANIEPASEKHRFPKAQLGRTLNLGQRWTPPNSATRGRAPYK